MEFRLHGRGGQGGVTCAKILAGIYARLGKHVQAFGDYAGERSGAPVRAYLRVSDRPITDRNKVYRPDHLLILDPSLLTPEVTDGLAPGGLLLLNTQTPPDALERRYDPFHLAVVDATSIARRHGIGTRSLVIVNTTVAGAFMRAMELPFEVLEDTYRHLGLAGDLEAAREAWNEVHLWPPVGSAGRSGPAPGPPRFPAVLGLTQHRSGPPTGLKTGSWRTQRPAYVTHPAPCVAACPAGNNVVGFIQTLLRDGEAAAAEVLARSTPFPGVCGRVCPAPCMAACNRRGLDGSVNVRGLERWIADHVQGRPVTRPEPAATSRSVAVVGGGPAGLAAAWTVARAGHRSLVLEGEFVLGGVLRTGIPRYRLPREVLDREVAAILDLGVETRLGEFLDATALAELERDFDAVVLATGLARPRSLEVPGADLPGVEQGIAFLRQVNLGTVRLSGHVVVLGGGNTAMDCARAALRRGADRVTVAYRRSREEMPAIAEEVEEAAREGVDFLILRQPVGFYGPGRVEGVHLAEVELGAPDESGRRRPVVTDRRALLDCDHVLLALGQAADPGVLPAGWELHDGRVMQDGRPLRVFIAGDLSTGEGTVAHAIGDGRRAAQRALADLGEAQEPWERPDPASATPPWAMKTDRFLPRQPTADLLEPASERTRDFREVNYGLVDATEARRCWSCGTCTHCDTCLVYCPEGVIHRADGGYRIDLDYCKGCGLCVSECPRSAMEMLEG